jgi:hypothetical protein
MTKKLLSIKGLLLLFLMGCFNSYAQINQQLDSDPLLDKSVETINDNNSNVNFIENKGQWPSDVHYMMNLYGQTAWFTQSGIRFDVWRDEIATQAAKYDFETVELDAMPEQGVEGSRKGHVFDFDLVNAAGEYSIAECSKSSTYFNYLLGADSSKWASNVALYHDIDYKNAWEGIDVHYYSSSMGGLEYDFLVAPQSNPEQIRLRLKGGVSRIHENGNLVVKTQLGDVEFSAPKSYQEINGEKQLVHSRYIQNEDGTISFGFPEGYNKNIMLTIDPVLTWSTYLGGSNNTFGVGLALDAANNVIVLSRTTASNFPTTLGVYDQTLNGIDDVAVSKLNVDATALIFSTFIGGSSYDFPYNMKLFSSGDIVVVGRTISLNYPVTPGAYGSVGSLFVTKLNMNGTALIYSSRLNVGSNIMTGCAITSSGEVVVGGSASGNGAPTTVGAYDQNNNGSGDGYLIKFNNSGTGLVFCTYFGGAGLDVITDIIVKPNDNLIVVGYTNSSNLPTTVGAYDQTLNGGYDGFVAEFNPSVSALLWSTYLGGNANEDLRYSKINNLGEIVVSGGTQSNNFPTTLGAYDQTYAGTSQDLFLSKLSSDGSVLLASTYLGSAGNESPFGGLLVDGNNDISMLAYLPSGSLPITTGAIQSSVSAQGDFYLCKLSSDLSTLLYGTYLGGSVGEYLQQYSGNQLARHDSCIVFSGYTNSSDFPITPGVYQPNILSAISGVIVKICDVVAVLPVEFAGVFAICEEDKNVVHWSTISEHNNSHFVVERTLDGVNWEIIGTVDGSGNSTSVISYQLDDYERYSQEVYYRVKQVDFNGEFDYSSVVSLNRNQCTESSEMQIFPNPFENYIEVWMDGIDPNEFVMTDLSGRLLTDKITITLLSKDVAILQVADLPSGAYFLKYKEHIEKMIRK